MIFRKIWLDVDNIKLNWLVRLFFRYFSTIFDYTTILKNDIDFQDLQDSLKHNLHKIESIISSNFRVYK